MRGPWRILARDADRKILGALNSWQLTLNMKKNFVGDWNLQVPLELASPNWPNAGDGIIILEREQVIASGSWFGYNWSWKSDPSSDDVHPGTFRIAGGTDLERISYHIVYPSYNRTWPNQNQTAHYTYTNNAEEVMRVLVNRQCGSLALPERQVPGLRLGPVSIGSGPAVTMKERFTPVLEALRKTADESGLIFDIRDNLHGFTDFHVIEPQDLTNKVRFAIELQNVTEMDIQRSAPTASVALIAGQEEGVARQLVEVVSPSVNPLWGRREQFGDQRQTDDENEHVKAGERILEDGEAKFSVRVKVEDTKTVQWGRDYNLGDKVSVRTPFGEVAALIEGVTINVDSQGNTEISTTIGADDVNNQNPLAKVVWGMQRRLSQIERAQ